MSDIQTGDHFPINLADLPDSWRSVYLGEAIADIQPGFASGEHNSAGVGIPHIRPMNISRDGGIDLAEIKYVSADKPLRLRRGDVLFNNTNSPALVGKTAAITRDEDWAFSNHMTRLGLPTGMENRFVAFQLHYLWMSGYFRHRCVNHVNQASISTKTLSNTVPLAIPPSREQKRIATKIEELFSDLDAGVAALERVKAKLKRYRAAVLKAAVEGKLTAEWRKKNRPTETGQQLLDRILVEHRHKWEEEQLAAYEKAGTTPPAKWKDRYAVPAGPDASTLPELPNGWCWASVRQVGKVQLGRQRAPQHHFGPHMRPYLRVANVFEDRIDISDVMEMNFTPEEYEVYRLHYGDILLNEGQSMELVGRPAVYRDEVPGACFTNTLVRFQTSPDLDNDYAMAVFLTYLKNGRFQKIATITVNIAHLGAGRFAGLEFPLPPLEEQKEIVAEVNRRLSLLKAIESLINSNLKRSGRLRQSILKRAFEGKLVPQDPNDEPVSVLLERIRSAKGAAAGPQDAVSAPRSKESRKVFIRRAAVVSYTIRRLAGHKSFGRTQLEKTLHLTQSHLGVDLELVFERYKAGPFDKTIYKLEAVAKKNDWFTTQGRNGPGVTYHPGTKIDDACKYAGGILGRKQADLDRLLDHISKMDTDQAELFATAYAAWNDLLIDGRPADDLAIAAEIHGWHESKKRFTGKGLLLASAGCVSTDMCPPAKDSGRQ